MYDKQLVDNIKYILSSGELLDYDVYIAILDEMIESMSQSDDKTKVISLRMCVEKQKELALSPSRILERVNIVRSWWCV